MRRIRLGKTNMLVSRIGLGGIPIQRVAEDDAISVVRECLGLGITFIDTAAGYTSSEERIGKAIAGGHEGLTVATKTLARTAKEVNRDLRLSLKHLGVESIDLYQFHNVSDLETMKEILAPGGAMSVVEHAKELGLVRHIGVTSHSLDTAKDLLKSGYFETIMFPLNLIEYEAAIELVPIAREYDVGFIAMKPLGGGRLANVNLALKYLSQFRDVVCVVGIEKVAEALEIVDCLEGSPVITESEKEEMNRLRSDLSRAFCRRCDYCQPCAQGISISLVLQYPSMFKCLPPESIFFGPVDEAMSMAANCSKCGDCEERCPYHLSIRETLAAYVAQHLREKLK